MKAGWKTGALASISEVFTDGNWIESKDQSTDGIRLVQTGNVGEGVFKDRRDKARWIDQDTFARLNCFDAYLSRYAVSLAGERLSTIREQYARAYRPQENLYQHCFANLCESRKSQEGVGVTHS